MKIVISCLPFDNGRSGISVYMREIISALLADNHELTLICEEKDKKMLPKNVQYITAPSWTKNAILSMLYHLFILPFVIKKELYDFCIIAAANRRTFAWYRLFTICVVHDLAQYHIKNKYDFLRMIYLKKVLPWYIRKAPAVVAISKSTRDDLIKYYKVDPKKITVAYNGFKVKESTLPTDFYPKKYNLTPKKYIFYVSRIEHPGKNHLNVVKAFEMLPQSLRDEYKLVFAGADWHGAETVYKYVADSKCKAQILFTGFVEEAELESAYLNAKMYIFGSFFEGFGLSLCEAMYYKVPCCCSNTSSLKEIGEGAALLFDPYSPQAIADAMQELLEDKNNINERLIALGLERYKEFNWQKCVRKMVNIYEEQ